MPQIRRFQRPDAGSPPAAFTLLEVMVAAAVLTLSIAGSLLVVQRGLQAVDTARNLTTATQAMGDEMEQLRLKSWAQIQQLQDGADASVPLDRSVVSERFQCTRVIRDVKIDMKEIVLTASWHGYDGRPHSASLITRYSRHGLNDYYYTIR